VADPRSNVSHGGKAVATDSETLELVVHTYGVPVGRRRLVLHALSESVGERPIGEALDDPQGQVDASGNAPTGDEIAVVDNALADHLGARGGKVA